jgi:hypothetical protein
MRALSSLLLISVIALPGLSAQAPVAHPVLSLRTGDTVRVWTTSPAEQVGVISRLTQDTLGINRLSGGLLSYPIAALSHVDVQRGRRHHAGAIALGIVLGAATGGIAGGLLGAQMECEGDCYGEGGVVGFLIGGALGIIVGGVGGGIVGAQFKMRRWERVYP